MPDLCKRLNQTGEIRTGTTVSPVLSTPGLFLAPPADTQIQLPRVGVVARQLAAASARVCLLQRQREKKMALDRATSRGYIARHDIKVLRHLRRYELGTMVIPLDAIAYWRIRHSPGINPYQTTTTGGTTELSHHHHPTLRVPVHCYRCCLHPPHRYSSNSGIASR